MLIPLHDDNPLRHIHFQFVTVAIILACVAVFFYQASLGAGPGQQFVLQYGMIPAVLFGTAELPPELAMVPAEATLITSMFLHGSWMHLIGNMLFLWVLGDNVEDATGHLRFIVFYLVCGAMAALAHGMTEPASQIPTIGASGAISGVIGAYVVLHPRASIATLVFRVIVRLPAFVVLGLWILYQVAMAYLSGATGGGVAWWAHIGGFLAGAILIVFFRKRNVRLLDGLIRT